MTTVSQTAAVRTVGTIGKILAIQLACLGIWCLAGGHVDFTRGDRSSPPVVVSTHPARHPGKAHGQP